jgi:hypothetical protein
MFIGKCGGSISILSTKNKQTAFIKFKAIKSPFDAPYQSSPTPAEAPQLFGSGF